MLRISTSILSAIIKRSYVLSSKRNDDTLSSGRKRLFDVENTSDWSVRRSCLFDWGIQRRHQFDQTGRVRVIETRPRKNSSKVSNRSSSTRLVLIVSITAQAVSAKMVRDLVARYGPVRVKESLSVIFVDSISIRLTLTQ